MKSEGKDYLDGFIPVYVNLLLNDKEIKNELSQIIIEGHTDNVGSYIYNMELSQKRAFEVVKYIYTEMKDFEGKSELEKYPIGAPIKFANYSLFRTPDKEVYLLVDDKLRHFESAEVLR